MRVTKQEGKEIGHIAKTDKQEDMQEIIYSQCKTKEKKPTARTKYTEQRLREKLNQRNE